MASEGGLLNSGVVVREKYKICMQCGNFSHFSENVEFCILCGFRLIDECPECREPILYPTALYCPVCGRALRKSNGTNTK